MRKNIFGCLVVLSLAAVVSGGCAKKDMVKPEEPVATSQNAPQTAPATESAAPKQTPPAEAKMPAAETPAQEAQVRQEAAPAAAGQPAAAGGLENELQKIYFNFDSAALSDEARNALTKNADLLNKNSNVSIRIEGNCDERGSDEYNLALGERRANAARDYLVSLGIKPERISVISYGEEKPADPGHDEAAWAKNRRDEFVIVK